MYIIASVSLLALLVSTGAALPSAESQYINLHYFVESIDKDIVTYAHKYKQIPEVPLEFIQSAFPSGCQGHERGEGDYHLHSVVCKHTPFFDFGPSVDLTCRVQKTQDDDSVFYEPCRITRTTATIVQHVIGNDESSLAIREPFYDTKYVDAILKTLPSSCSVDKSNSSLIHCPPYTNFAAHKYVTFICHQTLSSSSPTIVECKNDLPTSWPVEIPRMSFRVDAGTSPTNVAIVPMHYRYEPDPHAVVTAFSAECSVENDGIEDMVICPETESLSLGTKLWISCVANKNSRTRCRIVS